VTLRLKIYVTAVLAVAVLVLSGTLPADLRTNGLHYLAWIGICAASESLWLPTMSGTGTATMASTAGLAAIVLWGRDAACWIAAISSLIAELAILRKPLIRASFNAGQITLTTWLAGAAFALLGGPIQGLEHLGRVAAAGELVALRLAPGILGMLVVYHLGNRGFVAAAVAWSTERPFLRVLREDWYYAARLIDDAPVFLLSPLMVLSFKAIGYVGVVLFYLPLRMFNESHRRYLELQKAQRMIIHTERMAAKGEMAAEIGHELRNILSAISARAQMISKESERGAYDHLARNTQIILEQSKRMETMSRGLMDFSHVDLKIERVELNALMLRTVEFVRTANRFDGVEWDLKLAEVNPELRADPGQLQQVLMNLFMNAADAMNEQKDGERKPKRISVTTTRDDRTRQVTVVISDTGPGIPASNLSRIFEPHFTTKATGHGFGLSTSYRIVDIHKGRITAESPAGGGACFTVTLPIQGPGGAWA
jgi:signal transduction histidine kinase